MPGPEIVRSIYYQMISGHLGIFEPDVAKMAGKLTDATIDLHKTVMNNFLPSSVKFHYQFNLREMSNITQVRFSAVFRCPEGTVADLHPFSAALACSCAPTLLCLPLPHHDGVVVLGD